jgi:hypothetical protein
MERIDSILGVLVRVRNVYSPFVIFGPPNDCSMMTLRPTKAVSASGLVTMTKERTFRAKSHRNSVCKDVHTPQDSSAALVGELNLLVRAAREGWRRASRLEGCAAEGTGGGARDGVHYE